MKESIFDKVVDQLSARRDVIRARLALDYKRTKPFRKEVIPLQELLSAYNELKPQDMQMLTQKHGEEKVNQFISEMELLKDKEVLNAFTRKSKT